MNTTTLSHGEGERAGASILATTDCLGPGPVLGPRTSGLDLGFRGGDLGDDLARLLDLQSQPVTNGTSACCIGDERDPACLETVPSTVDPATLDATCPVLCP